MEVLYLLLFSQNVTKGVIRQLSLSFQNWKFFAQFHEMDWK